MVKYILVNEKNHTGFKGVRLTNDNINTNTFPERVKKIWLGAGIIKEAKEKKEVLTKTEK